MEKTKIISGIITGIFFIIVFLSFRNCINSVSEEPILLNRKDSIEVGFSAWDGSHINLTEIIKESMNDPKSYEHVKTVYWDMQDHLIIQTTFRGKNAFGGVIANTIKAKADISGNDFYNISQEP